MHPAGRLAALGNESSVLLFDLATGRELGKLPTTDRPLRWNSAGSTAHLWRIGPAKLAGPN